MEMYISNVKSGSYEKQKRWLSDKEMQLGISLPFAPM